MGWRSDWWGRGGGRLDGIDVGEAVRMGAAGSGGSDHFCNDVYYNATDMKILMSILSPSLIRM